MISNHLPVAVTDIISNELTQLDKNRSYNLPPESRIALYEAIGPSCLPHYRTRRKTLKVRELPNWTKADCVRSQLSLLTARKVLPLWEIACQESEKSFTQVDWQHKSEEVHREEVYLRKREIQPIEEISVYDVPRTYTPVHILDMTELALAGGIQDFSKFAYQANEWWQIYPWPELMEREFFITEPKI